MQREKIVSINGLKGFSCIIILLYHYRFFLLDNGIEIIDYGHYFVELFVTISGFLIAYNYREKIIDMNFKDFFFRRYMKIMPLYWITEICMYVATILATVLSGQKYEWKFFNVLQEFSGFYTGWFGQTKLPLNNSLWTVCCILLCYFLYYFICKISRTSFSIYIVLILFVLGCGIDIMWHTSEKKIYFFIGKEDCLRCVLSFMIGVLLYELYQRVSKRWGKRISYLLFLILIGGIAYNKNLPDEMIETTISSIVIFILCPFMLCSAIYIPIFKYIYSSRLLQWAGVLSMDIYMWHWVVRAYLGSRPFYLEQRTWIGFCTLIIVSIIVSVISHFIIMPRIYGIGDKRERTVL